MTVDAPEVTWTRHTFAAMGTVVVVSLPTSSETTTLHGRVETLFGRVERSCTRFDEGSDLMRANADPASSHEVAPECAAIVGAAYEAYRTTGGLFDPRVLDRLLAVGYDRTFAEISTAGGVRCRPRRSHRCAAGGSRRSTLARQRSPSAQHPSTSAESARAGPSTRPQPCSRPRSGLS
jgi:hypothetical protein